MPTKKPSCDSCGQPMQLILKTEISKKYHCELCDISKTVVPGEFTKVVAQARSEHKI